MLLKQAVVGIKAGAPKNSPKILVHLPSGGDWDGQQYFYDSVLQYKNFTLDDFDMQGISFYPFYGMPESSSLLLSLLSSPPVHFSSSLHWLMPNKGTSATLANLNSTLTQMAARYGKELIIAETDWPVACAGGPPLSEPSIPVSVAGQVLYSSSFLCSFYPHFLLSFALLTLALIRYSGYKNV